MKGVGCKADLYLWRAQTDRGLDIWIIDWLLSQHLTKPQMKKWCPVRRYSKSVTSGGRKDILRMRSWRGTLEHLRLRKNSLKSIQSRWRKRAKKNTITSPVLKASRGPRTAGVLRLKDGSKPAKNIRNTTKRSNDVVGMFTGLASRHCPGFPLDLTP